MNAPADEGSWFVLMVKSRHEKAVTAALRGKGLPVFLPLIEKRVRTAGHNRITQLPLFPTYVFSRFDPLNRLPVLTIPGVFSIVCVGNVPAPVDDKEISAIQTLVRCTRDFDACQYVGIGEMVEVIQGPLAGLQGTLREFRGKWRLVLSVTLLQRATSVEIDRAAVRRVIPRMEVQPCARIKVYMATGA